MTLRLRGLSAFPITPADGGGHVDAAALRGLVARLVAAKVDSIGLLGSTGTYAYLARAERRRAIEAALAETSGAVPVVVGVGALRTDDAVALAEDAKAAGADAGLLAPMSYTPLTDDEVFEHFAAVARSDLPLVIYDNPGTTHFRFSSALVGRLARVDGTIAVKSPAPDADAAAHLAVLRQAVPKGFSVGVSGDWNSVAALIAGADAWSCVFAGLFPHAAMAIVDAVRAGDHDAARRLDAALQPLWALFNEFSSLRVMYAAANILGLTQAQPPRPILPLDGVARARVRETLAALQLS